MTTTSLIARIGFASMLIVLMVTFVIASWWGVTAAILSAFLFGWLVATGEEE